MFKKYLYDNVLNMVGFADRNQNLHLAEVAKDTTPEESKSEDAEENNMESTAIQTLTTFEQTTATHLAAPKTPRKHKQSDIYSDVPFLVLPFDKLPKSSIVYDEEKSNTEKAYLLYKKYIQTGAEFEINIAGGLRADYRATFDNRHKWMTQIGRGMDIGDLAEIFDKCNDVNLGLMSHSFIRFKRTPEWAKVVQAITSKQSIDFNPEDMGFED